VNSSLSGKWVLITGASSGFGAAAARAFAAAGGKLLLGARRVDRLEKIAGEIRQPGAGHALDVASTASVEKFAAWARGKTARVDVLINNAGGAHGLDPVASGRDEDWEAMFQSNVLGLLRVTRAVLPMMLNNPGSSILSIGSVAGHTAYEGGAVYCAAKAGERKITQALRLELNGTGIRRLAGSRAGGDGVFHGAFQRRRGEGAESLSRHPPAHGGRHRGNAGLDGQPPAACQH